MFRTKAGIPVNPVSVETALLLREKTLSEFGILPVQVTEACAYSFAMVVRFALGLSAEGAKTACIVNDSMAGLVALATARHLLNSGADVELIFAGSLDGLSAEMEHQLNIFGGYGASLTVFDKLEETEGVLTLLGSCHNSLHGMSAFGTAATEFGKSINDMLNDLATPIYAVEFPLSMDPHTGKSQGSVLYASATLCLGVPTHGILHGEDYCGRVYVCDALIPRPLYQQHGLDYSLVFSEQPVQQLIRVTESAE